MLNSWLDALGYILAFTVLFAFPIWFSLYVAYQIFGRLTQGKSQQELSLDEFKEDESVPPVRERPVTPEGRKRAA